MNGSICPETPDEEDIEVIDVDAEAWKEIKKSAQESNWIPKEYMMNDWVADVCRFLRGEKR